MHFTPDTRQFTVRRAVETDAQNIIDYSKILFASTDQVLTTPEEYTITLDGERAWINNFNQNPNALVLIAEINKQVVGLLFFVPNAKKKIAHTGEFGVSVHPAYQQLGIGRHLIMELVTWAKKNQVIEKVFLTVFHTNTNAIKLYEELGFIQEGRHVKAVKQVSGEYVDIIQMFIGTCN